MTEIRSLADVPTVVVADGDPIFHAFVAGLVKRISLPVVAVTTGADALAAAHRSRPALVVLDVGLPDVSGFEICRELRDQLGDELPVILVSAEKTDDLDRAAGILLGADDYLAKPLEPTLFMARVRRLVGRAPAPTGTVDDVAAHDDRFTPRERQILALLADGHDPASIARSLVISPRTVGSHIQRLLSKLEVHSQAQAVAAAYRQGLIGGWTERGPQSLSAWGPPDSRQ